jgi:hypothetical protein
LHVTGNFYLKLRVSEESSGYTGLNANRDQQT